MVVRENSVWQDVLKVPNLSLPYFHGRFLKAKSGAKSDGTQTFQGPKTPIEFLLIIDHDQWLQAEMFKENASDHQVNTDRSVSAPF
jgi:hypothetical protein